MPVILSCRDLSRAFDAHPLFEDLTLAVDQRSRLGIIGPNGSGKSTLMRIFAGLEEADDGERAIMQGTSIVYLPQRDEFAPGVTSEQVLLDTLASSHPHWEEHKRQVQVSVILGQAGFGSGTNPRSDQAVEELSGGWRKRLAIARAMAQMPDLMLMDEPTNHLDLEGIWWLERLLMESTFTFVVISHDRFFLERICDRVVEINKIYPGGSFSSQGGYSSFLQKRAEHVANQARQQESLDNKVRREIEWLQRNPAAQTKKSKSRVESAGQLINDLASMKFRNSQDRRVDLEFAATGRRTNDLVVVDNVSKGLGGKPLFAEVEMVLSPGSRLGILGLNGSGKTTFLKVLAKQLAPDVGTVKHATGLRVEIFDQKREKLDQKQSLRHALCPTGQTVVYQGRGIHIASWAKRFLFKNTQLDLEVSKLSGGEQARVMLANLMKKEADLLILDEPTNDLDIPSLEVLEESLLEFPGAVVLVTHDRYLLDRVSTSLLALDGNGNAYRVADCAQWEQLAERLESQKPSSQQVMNKGVKRDQNAKEYQKNTSSGLSSKERKELDRMQEKIQGAEAKLEELTTRAADPKVAADAVALTATCAELAEAQSEVERLYTRWVELEAKAK